MARTKQQGTDSIIEQLKEKYGAYRVQEREDKLLVTLPDDEWKERARALQREQSEHDELEMRTKEALRAMKEELGGKKDRIRKLTEIVGTGKERRVVPVVDLFDARTWMCVTHRLDTGEEVTRRPMREDERQMEMPLP